MSFCKFWNVRPSNNYLSDSLILVEDVVVNDRKSENIAVIWNRFTSCADQKDGLLFDVNTMDL